jgi:histidinol-phosphate aminotransferase
MSPATRRTVGENVRGEVRDLPAYVISEAAAAVRLDRNESPGEISPAIRSAILAEVESRRWSRYPDPYARDLKQLAAAREGLTADHVLVGNGSNSLFLSLFAAVGGPGRRFAITPPTFSLYAPWLRATGAAIQEFPVDEETLQPPARRLVEAARSDPDLSFVLCSPNNPTGVSFPRAGLEEVLDTGALVVLDEAYAEFAGASALDLLARYPNLAITRTLSKAAALAAVRVGFLFGHPDLLTHVEKLVPPYSVNVFARAAAGAVLGAPTEIHDRVRSIVDERERVLTQVAAVAGARVRTSSANFVYLRTDRPAAEIWDALRARGVLVRKVAGTRADAIRVTIGRPEENDAFLRAWREVMG